MGSRRVHLRARRNDSRDRGGACSDARHASRDGRCLGPRILGSDPVHAADGARDHHRPRARLIAADGAPHSRRSRDGRERRAAQSRSSPSSRSPAAGSTGDSAWCSAPCSRSRSHAGWRASTTARWPPPACSGSGSIWAQGLSGSAALQMATSGALQPAIRDIVSHGGMVPGGMIPFRHTIFLWQSFAAVAVEIVVVVGVMWLATPPAGRGKTARDLGIDPRAGRPRTTRTTRNQTTFVRPDSIWSTRRS